MRRGKKGFTILEIIITIVVSGAIFAGVMPLIFKTITTNKSARLKLNAYESAHRELENMRGQAVSDMTEHAFTVMGVPGGTGHIYINRTLNGVAQTDIAAITSRVNWSFNGKNEQVELKTYLYGVSE
jgi:prepilin-type N-terminal cleavage/methylation domain-containing protein